MSNDRYTFADIANLFKLVLKGKKIRTNNAENKSLCEKSSKKKEKVLFESVFRFSGTKDTRRQSYTEYSNKELLGIMFYKGIVGIESMQSMTYEFAPENVTQDILCSLGEKTYLLHAVTSNEYLEKYEPEKLQKVQLK